MDALIDVGQLLEYMIWYCVGLVVLCVLALDVYDRRSGRPR